MLTYADISKKILIECLGTKVGEYFLVLTDDVKEELAQQLYNAAQDIGLIPMLLKIPKMKRPGEEPPRAAAKAMKYVDVAVCITEHSLTHTNARIDAALAGVRIATMPGITKEMFLKGAINADYTKVEKITNNVSRILTSANNVVIEKEKYRLELNIQGRKAVRSTGRYLGKGQSGNLPSGETYIAPVEGTAHGSVLVDGSLAGVGKLESPVLLTIEKGLLICADGDKAGEWLKMLGDSKAARNVAEFGIGTNPNAILTGNILEDEKILGTIHVAFGSNNTFGGNVSAGVHLDAVILSPTVYLDGKMIMNKGRLTSELLEGELV